MREMLRLAIATDLSRLRGLLAAALVLGILFSCSDVGASGRIVAWGYNNVGQASTVPWMTNCISVAGGFSHSLALRKNGTVLVWGDNQYDQTNAIPGLDNVVAIDCGQNHSVALRADGSVVAWGNNWYGQTNVPAVLSNLATVAVSAGAWQNLVLQTNGHVVAFGYDPFGRMAVPAGLSNVIAVSGGGIFNLALRADGTVAAWGELSDLPSGLSNVVAISAGHQHAIVLLASGTIVAWGHAGYTQVPLGLSNVVAIAAGGEHSLALKEDGTVVAWGDNASDQTDVPVGLSNVVTIATGYAHNLALIGEGLPAVTVPPRSAVALAGGSAVFGVEAVGAWPLGYQWQCNGTNIPGATQSWLVVPELLLHQSGDQYSVVISNTFGTAFSSSALLTVYSEPPSILSQPKNVIALRGAAATLSVVSDGGPPPTYQWQRNGVAIFGATNSILTLLEVNEADIGNYSVIVSNVAGSVTSSNAFLSLTSVAAWNSSGTAQSIVPSGMTNLLAVASGANHSLSLRSDGTVIAWGDNSFGQTNVPVGLSNVVIVAGGDNHSLAVRSDGTLAAWGQNNVGQASVPAGVSNAVSAAGGNSHSLALRSDGTVLAWGRNNFGQTNVPATLSNVIAVASGSFHSLALRADGTVVSWGRNNFGQTNVPSTPKEVVAISARSFRSLALQADGNMIAWGSETNVAPDLDEIIGIAAGSGHNLALRALGTVAAWGAGPTNVPIGLSNIVAVAAGFSHNLALVGETLPMLAMSPQPATVPAGGDAVFRAEAVGGWPLRFQWQCNGTNLPHETRPWLLLRGVAAEHSGLLYSVIVSNDYGSVTSSNALLTVFVDAAAIVMQPTNVTAFVGGTTALSVATRGAPPPYLQWRFNGSDIPNATNSVLQIASVSTNDAGAYDVVVANSYGAVTSSVAMVTVRFPPRFTDVSMTPFGTPLLTLGGSNGEALEASDIDRFVLQVKSWEMFNWQTIFFVHAVWENGTIKYQPEFKAGPVALYRILVQ